MTKLEKLLQNYERYASIRWEPTLAGPQRVWFAERVDAEDAVKSLLSSRGRREYNIPDASGWKLSY